MIFQQLQCFVKSSLCPPDLTNGLPYCPENLDIQVIFHMIHSLNTCLLITLYIICWRGVYKCTYVFAFMLFSTNRGCRVKGDSLAPSPRCLGN